MSKKPASFQEAIWEAPWTTEFRPLPTESGPGQRVVWPIAEKIGDSEQFSFFLFAQEVYPGAPTDGKKWRPNEGKIDSGVIVVQHDTKNPEMQVGACVPVNKFIEVYPLPALIKSKLDSMIMVLEDSVKTDEKFCESINQAWATKPQDVTRFGAVMQ
jgi:hypothetical protein